MHDGFAHLVLNGTMYVGSWPVLELLALYYGFASEPWQL